MRTYVALLHEYLEEMEELTDEEFGRLCRGLLRYSATGEVIEPIGNERFYIKHAMAQEDRHQASYETLTQKRSEAGKKAAQVRWDRERELQSYAIAYNINTNTKTKNNTENNTKSFPGADDRAVQSLALDVEKLKREGYL